MIKTTSCLKVTLDDVTPTVMHRIQVPFDIRMDRLHLVLQTASGWMNSHLYEFSIGGVGLSIPYPQWADGPLDARKATLKAVIEKTGAKTFKYFYDFGVSVYWILLMAYHDGLKLQGSSSSRRLLGWPCAIAVRVMLRYLCHSP